jgi:protein O-GlcNAc transferase
MERDAAALQLRFREGLALHRLGDLAAAERIYREVRDENPVHFDATHMLGVIALQRRQTAEGIALVEQAIAQNDRIAAAHNNLGKAWLDLKRPDKALPCFERAIACDADFAEAHIHRAAILRSMHRLEAALDGYRKAAALRSDDAELQRNCGNLLSIMRRYDEAFAAYDQAYRLDPDMPGVDGFRTYANMHLCDWQNRAADTARLAALARSGRPATQPFVFLGFSASPADQLACAHAWANRNFSRQAPRWRGEHYSHDRIRIAYVSADFRHHAASMLTAGLFECHDKARFEITAISLSADDGSEIGQRVRSAFEHFVDATNANDDEVADLIKTGEIDIAVDLMGFTTNSRTGIFARRPAPVQAHYLGFPGTMGASYMDYVIADATAIPPGARAFYSEKVVALPDSYFVNDRNRTVAARALSRAELGLPATGFVFCCFNSNHKISPATFDVWMRILHQVDGSVLWLLASHAQTADNLRKEAAARGVSPARLVFAPRMPVADHLARHRAVDLFLDTLPYNAHTTACDALWAGLPVLTCAGEAFAGRVGASLLKAIGLPELVTASRDDYERRAVALARGSEELARLKARLAENRLAMPLFDTALFTRRLEAAYTEMQRRQQAGLPPDDIDVQA